MNQYLAPIYATVANYLSENAFIQLYIEARNKTASMIDTITLIINSINDKSNLLDNEAVELHKSLSFHFTCAEFIPKLRQIHITDPEIDTFIYTLGQFCIDNYIPTDLLLVYMHDYNAGYTDLEAIYSDYQEACLDESGDLTNFWAKIAPLHESSDPVIRYHVAIFEMQKAKSTGNLEDVYDFLQLGYQANHLPTIKLLASFNHTTKNLSNPDSFDTITLYEYGLEVYQNDPQHKYPFEYRDILRSLVDIYATDNLFQDLSKAENYVKLLGQCGDFHRHCQMAQKFLELNNPDKFQVYFDAAMENGYTFAYAMLIMILLNAGDTASAQKFIQKLQELAKDFLDRRAMYCLGCLYLNKNYPIYDLDLGQNFARKALTYGYLSAYDILTEKNMQIVLN